MAAGAGSACGFQFVVVEVVKWPVEKCVGVFLRDLVWPSFSAQSSSGV